MLKKRIPYLILGAFISGTLLLIYIQYNSSKNINTLINGNEKLLKEFKVSRDLKELESDIYSVESKTRGTLITENASRLEELEGKIKEVKSDLEQLQKISDDDSTVKFIDELDQLVQKKLLFSEHLIDSFHNSGKPITGNIIASPGEKVITDSIINFVQLIDNTRQKLLEKVTVSIDESGKKVQQLSNTLIVLVLVSGAALFWYIINIIRKQMLLIEQLNTSEKKVKESVQVKENFMANMSHEIRTPMNAIIGFTHLLEHKNLDEESKEYVHTIKKSGEGLLEIINDILDLSKIEAGMVRIESAPFSIRGLLHSIENMLKPKSIEKKLEFTVEVEESIPDMLEGDATRLTQILLNLIGNALKFTERGSVVVKITNEGISENVINTGITVKDTGIGVEKNKLQGIFERFQQGEDAVTRKYGGTGLGLSIVKDLVSLQNGTISVQSEPGKGSTFKIVIPYKTSSAIVYTEQLIQNSSTDLGDIKNINVLVVEDNETNKKLIKHLFKRWQLHFDQVSNGREAIEILKIKKYDLIMMDIQMPEMDGYTATTEIRLNLKITTPIIAMTAHALAGEREKCLSVGMNEYIAKPFQEIQLFKLISQFTLAKKASTIEKENFNKEQENKFIYIHLNYIKEIGGGNLDFEKDITGQFIDAVPLDLALIEKAFNENDMMGLRQLAHNMKTTVSVMGLNEILQPHLDALEYGEISEESFRNTFKTISSICIASVTEAKQLYSTY